MSDTWGDIWTKVEYHEWEEILGDDEFRGGPSPWGNSKYSYMDRCEWLYNVRFNLRMKPKQKPDYLQIGGLLHECKARYFQTYVDIDEEDPKGKLYTRREVDQACLESLWSLVNRAQDVVPLVASEVRRLLKEWVMCAGPGTNQDDRHETLHVEELVEVPVRVAGFPYSCRKDRIVWDREVGGPVIAETKTAARETDVVNTYQNDNQVIGQVFCWNNSWLFDAYGPLKGVRLDMIIKTAQVEVFSELIQISDEVVEDFAKTRKETYKSIKRCRRNDYWPRRRNNCVMYNKRCSLFDSCLVLAKGKDPFPNWVKKADGEW